MPGVGSSANGLANDVGLALDLRILKVFTVGAHVGYDVATVWFPGAACLPTVPICGASLNARSAGDGWLAYCLQAGVVFW